MDMMDVLVVLLRAGVVKVKIDVDVPEGFLAKLGKAVEDKVVNGVELADLIDAFRGK